MKRLTPEEIQRLAESKDTGFEASQITGQESEVEAYRQLMGLLDEGPDIGLRYDFTARLTRRIAAAADKRISLKWYIFSALLVCVAFGLSYLFILFYDFRAARQFIEFTVHFKWVLAFILVVFLSVQYLDRRLSRQTRL
jgi:hypothetical protein